MIIRIFILNLTKKIQTIYHFLIAVFINLPPFFLSGNFINNWISIFYYLPMPYLMFFSKYFKK